MENGLSKKQCDTSKIFNIQILGTPVRESRKFGDKVFTKEIIKQFPKFEVHEFLF